MGCGTVGASAARLLLNDRETRRTRSSADIYLRKVVVRRRESALDAGVPSELISLDYRDILRDEDVGIVVELVGGTDFAGTLIRESLQAGKHVVTANKALLAHEGPELFQTARKNGVSLAFESSCGGGIPIIRALTDGLTANNIDAIYGIVNGTSNFILTEMIENGMSYSEALGLAQESGLAEADPSLDVNGSDSAHKIAIMGSLAFGEAVALEQIPVKGIDTLQSEDVAFGSEMGYVIKLIASATRSSEGSFLRVEPAFINRDHPLAWISGAFNAISVYGHSVGHTMYYGRGAGGSPTASAVLADILSIANGSYPALFSSLLTWPDLSPGARLTPADHILRRYYIRLQLEDRAGILAGVTRVLAEYDISVSSVLQHEVPDVPESHETPVPLVITTHRVEEAKLTAALEKITRLDHIGGRYSMIPILDEHPEFQVW
ncbi:Homoserine dehydrogenase [Salinispira pacifica]|uniref:Homoserine dehydrogenase n=1 Tax=Salinispira pacifica TaxID=1307761 RepID=V5WDL0_9SPIO|nr:Homoserine dehydrogenase [Salinispira pacifica]